MRKALFTSLASLSMLICIGTIALWVRSYWVVDGVERIKYGRDVLLFSLAGHIGYESAFASSNLDVPIRFVSQTRPPGVGSTNSFYFEHNNRRSVVVVPCWLLVMLTAPLPIVWCMSYRQRQRRLYRKRNHLCPSCGYDLRASTERCPECGTAIPSPSPAGRGSG